MVQITHMVAISMTINLVMFMMAVGAAVFSLGVAWPPALFGIMCINIIMFIICTFKCKMPSGWGSEGFKSRRSSGYKIENPYPLTAPINEITHNLHHKQYSPKHYHLR